MTVTAAAIELADLDEHTIPCRLRLRADADHGYCECPCHQESR